MIQIKKTILTLVALLALTTGAWAQSTTHVVKQDNVNAIFSGDGYTLGNAVAAGDVLDFQGTIDLGEETSHSLVINKQVTIISSTKNAVVKLHTQSGSLLGDNPGNCFVINKAASGSTLQDIQLFNTEAWFYNTSNVTFTGVTFHVEEARVGAGVGGVSIRYSDHLTFDGCTFYTKNNGGSTALTVNASNNCTFQNCSFETEGNVGNILYLGNVFNLTDKPENFGDNDESTDCTVLNCSFTRSGTSAAMMLLGGLRHRIEGVTSKNLSISTAYGAATPASANDGHIYRNNTYKGSMTVLTYSTAENNTLTGNMTVQEGATATGNTITGNVTMSGANATATGNTITGNVTMSGVNATFTGNQVQGKVTASNKNAMIQGNTVISTEEYAVYLNSTADDANNAVKKNVLLGAFREGDDAVYCKKPEANTIIDNTAKAYDYELTVAKSEHGSGTIKFFIGDYELKGAYEKYEGKTVTMTVTPDEGYVVGSVTANAYTTWAGSRRNAPAAIPVLGNVTLTPVEGKANTWTFTMPAASVELKVGYLATSNLFLSKEALADKASIAVTAGETAVEFNDDGKSTTTVIEGRTVTTKYNGTKKVLGVKVAKKASLLSIEIGGATKATIYYVEGETWEQAIQNHPTENSAWRIEQGHISSQWYLLFAGDNFVNSNNTIDPNANYYFQAS